MLHVMNVAEYGQMSYIVRENDENQRNYLANHIKCVKLIFEILVNLFLLF